MTAPLNDTIRHVTERIVERSRPTRRAYLAQMRAAAGKGPHRARLSCGNLAHGFAACGPDEKKELARGGGPDIGIVTAYNDMLSAHQPLKDFPDIIKDELRNEGAVGQVAGGVPAMCDGVTQGQPGMDLSLFSRDVIAMGTAVALSHDMFDGAICLGVCDKIVPGLMIGSLRFGHLPVVFAPAGPMRSGIPNDEKAKIRQLFAEGKVGRDKLLAAESGSYHSPGTCTFYGTANSNQMLMEFMGMHVPGAAFPNPGTPLREALTRNAAHRVAQITALGEHYTPMCDVIDERAIVNGVIGLHATGGSTNHTLHLIAIARAAGIVLTWDDMDDLARVVPLMARVYPNGKADVNHFHAAGGLAFILRELIEHGLIHEEVTTVAGHGLRHYAREPFIDGDHLVWRDPPKESHDLDILRPVSDPFAATGGLKVLKGPLGRSVIKVSAVKPENRVVEAPAIVFDSQEEMMARFKAGELNRDFVAVVRFQGPRANGMPELHKLTPPLGVLQDKGFKVALVTDGRMSGASGKVPAAIHVSPEAEAGGPIARIVDGDIIRLDAEQGVLDVKVDPRAFEARKPASVDLSAVQRGYGRELFAVFRANATPAEEGASSIPFQEAAA
ncbi:MAG: phosphogluconate dehydratase [Pseudomonadota bacterium]|nr:phosphogluconate dehydratase [Pseudomonadota bacterium]